MESNHQAQAKPLTFRKAQDNFFTSNFLEILEGTRKHGQARVWWCAWQLPDRIPLYQIFRKYWRSWGKQAFELRRN